MKALLFLIAIQTAVIVVLLLRSHRGRRERTPSEGEERFRLVLDGAPIMIWTARQDATLDYLNRTCVSFTGLPIEQLLDEGWLDAVHPEDRDHLTRSYGAASEARAPIVLEYRVRRTDGVYRWLLATGIPRYGSDGAFEGYIGCDIDITDRKDAEEQVRESWTALQASHQENQQLAGSLLTAHEDERRRLARELHDDLTQRLARLAIDIGRMEQSPSANPILASVRQELVRLSEDVHALSYRLHPSVLDDLGLVEALKTECDRVGRQGALRVELDARGVPVALPAEGSLCLFRVAQEALSNAARHASASEVTVRLSQSDQGLQLAVSDNGSGFDPGRPRERPSLGLASMRERVRLVHGAFAIESTPGRGTLVVASVPG